jgi:hypothetical protein
LGREQQDAQELLRAVLDLVIADAGLDTSSSTTSSSLMTSLWSTSSQQQRFSSSTPLSSVVLEVNDQLDRAARTNPDSYGDLGSPGNVVHSDISFDDDDSSSSACSVSATLQEDEDLELMENGCTGHRVNGWKGTSVASVDGVKNGARPKHTVSGLIIPIAL